MHAVDALNVKAEHIQSLGELGCLVWTAGGSGETSLLSFTCREVVVRGGWSLLPCLKWKDERKWPELLPRAVQMRC